MRSTRNFTIVDKFSQRGSVPCRPIISCLLLGLADPLTPASVGDRTRFEDAHRIVPPIGGDRVHHDPLRLVHRLLHDLNTTTSRLHLSDAIRSTLHNPDRSHP